MELSPNFSAIMYDGLGWFSESDYKRMLLTFDEIFYLIPEKTVSFIDLTGKKEHIFFPAKIFEQASFKVLHYIPDENSRKVIISAAEKDISNSAYIESIKNIPISEQIYTWRILNTDGDINGGKSLNLSRDQLSLAQAVLLNKFLWAANIWNCIPISGKGYIHGLISEKYKIGVEDLSSKFKDYFPASWYSKSLKQVPISSKVISSFISEEDLNNVSIEEIIGFKASNSELFKNYNFRIRSLTKKISELPFNNNFSIEIEELLNTDVWKEKNDIENTIKDAWSKVFKNVIKAGVAGLVGVGITPFLSLGAITLASVATATMAISPWATSQIIDYFEAKKKAENHGLFYLMKFKEQHHK